MRDQIHGPINVVRLESPSKTLYIFFDYHEDVDKQTQCSSDRAITVKVFLENLFDKQTAATTDFFLEVDPYLVTTTTSHAVSMQRRKHENYIRELELWVTEHFHHKQQKRRREAMRSTRFPNVRLHYIDFRAYFHDVDEETCEDVELDAFCDTMEETFKELVSLLQKRAKKGKRQRFIDKLLTRYKDPSNKLKMTKYIRSNVLGSLETLLSFLSRKKKKILEWQKVLTGVQDDELFMNRTYGLTDDFRARAGYKIGSFVRKLSQGWMDILVTLVDLYFVRRLVEKDYISRAILYCGAFHSINVVMILVRYFSFRVTHAYYCSVDIESLNHEIMYMDSDDPHHLIRLLWPKTAHQCSSVRGMPFAMPKDFF